MLITKPSPAQLKSFRPNPTITKPQWAPGLEIIKGILFFWCRALMSIKTEFESPVVWFVFGSIIICIQPPCCRQNVLQSPDWQQPEWVEFNWFYYSQARAGLEQSLVSDLWWLWWLSGWLAVPSQCPSLTKTFRVIICIKGHHFIRETRHYQQQARKQSLNTVFQLTLIL